MKYILLWISQCKSTYIYHLYRYYIVYYISIFISFGNIIMWITPLWISQCKSTSIYSYRYYIVNLYFYISLSLGGNGIGIGPAIFWYWISYIDIKPTMLVLDQLFIGIGPAAIYRRGSRQNGGGLKEAATYFSSLIWSCSENDVGLSSESESESLFQWKWKFIPLKDANPNRPRYICQGRYDLQIGGVNKRASCCRMIVTLQYHS